MALLNLGGCSRLSGHALELLEAQSQRLSAFCVTERPFGLPNEKEGRSDATASFRLALEREKHHRAMFKEALKSFKQMKASA